jgi:alpha-tubulin suppressor-like RCC1 family protein
MRRWALLLLLLLVAALFASCKDATQVSVVLRTNVPYASGAGVALWSSRSGATTAPLVESTDPWLGDGEVGDVVVTPGDALKDSALTIRVAMGLRGKRAAECTDEGDVNGCIIARRKLAFVPHTRLKVPVVLYLACEGVKCTADTTCSYLGQCVPAQVDPAACATADGCSLPGEPPFVPGVTVDAGDAAREAGADGGVDVVADASADTGTDAMAGPTGPELTAGQEYTCARLDDGSVKCWGFNNFGQLGLGDTQSRGDDPGEMGANLPAVDLGPGRTALQVTAGSSHACARLDDGTVKCWGRNNFGQLGLGDLLERGDDPGEMGANLPAVNLGPGRTALQVTASASYTCARLDDGSVKCWGFNGTGQLGLGDTQHRGDGPGEMGANLPVAALGPGRTALQLTTASYSHTCARLDDGSVKCWGFNDNGQLGLGDTQSRGDGPGEMGANLPAVDLGAGRTALQLTAGNFQTCARLDDGSVKCWGWNLSGISLGLGDTQARGDGPGEMGASLPTVDLGAGRTVLQVAAGGAHTCARLDDGSVKCWGANDLGGLGLGDTRNRGDGPGEMGANLPAVDLGPGRTALQLTAGDSHTCARLDDGSVKCWGRNDRGQLGLGDLLERGDGPGEMGAALPVAQLK